MLSASPALHRLTLPPAYASAGSASAGSAAAGSAAARAVAAVTTDLAATLYRAVDAIGRSHRPAALALKSLAPFQVKLDAVKGLLASAPMEFTPAAGRNPVVVPIPRPDGSLARFQVVQTQVMEAGLAQKFPDIKTFRGVGIDDPTARLRLDYSPFGFHAQVLSVSGSYYVDPFFRNDAAGTYASYFKRDLQTDGLSRECDVIAPDGRALDERTEAALEAIYNDSLAADAGAPLSLTFGGQLRTYRAAVAATGEYTAFHGGTVAAGQAAIVTAMNRVNGVYETELGIRMVLVANNSSIVYTNAGSDPYTNNNGNTMLSQNINNLSAVIGNANFDIGHVFSTGGGGVAYLGSVGNNSIKAGGVTGRGAPVGDAFTIDYVAHEMGHQFGAEHTFNVSGNSNRAAGSAYEPGSGSTIMGYAGITSNDLQPNSDPHFHSHSLDQIRNFVTGSIPGVGSVTSIPNAAPTVNAGPSYTIPANTPFTLTATGSDPDGDAITFDWQQRDLGAANTTSSADNGTSPIIRVWNPTAGPSRTVPRPSNLLNNTFALGEKLPSVNRAAFKWRVVARDNKPGGGGVATADVTHAVVNTGAAFAVTAPNTNVTWNGGTTQTVTWNVAGTTGNGINTANVKISLSTDGGNTYPHVLAASTANDGAHAIVVPPALNSNAARLKVEAVGNIYFDIGNANFTLVGGPPPPGAIAGQVYEDRNADGALAVGSGDVPRNGVVVFLDADDDGALDAGEASVTTSGSGNFAFNALAAGTYRVRQVASGGHVATAPAGGAADVVVAAGQTSTQDFGGFPTKFGSPADDVLTLRRVPTPPVPAAFYTDHFNRAALEGGGYAYTTVVTGGDGAARVKGGDVLELTNDAGPGQQIAGAVYVTTPTAAFAGFNPQLSANAAPLAWTLNVQQIRPNPSGFATTNYGAAYVLGATAGALNNAASGYAVAIGNSSSPDPIRLIKFTGGLQGTLTTLAAGTAEAAANYWSVKVTYDPATSAWSLYTRNDNGGFADPADPSLGGGYVQSGATVADATHTAVPLAQAAAYWAYSNGAEQTAQFDNITLAPLGAGGGGGGGGGGAGGVPRFEILVGGVPTYAAPLGLVSTLTFDLGGGDDSLTIDAAHGGDPLPIGGLFYDGGDGAADMLALIGLAPPAAPVALTLDNAFAPVPGGDIHLNGAATGAQTVEKILLDGAVDATLAAAQHLASLDVHAGARLTLTPRSAGGSGGAGRAKVLNVGHLAFTAGGTLDLTNNDLIVRNGGGGGAGIGSASPAGVYDGLAGDIQRGRGAQALWDGAGLVSAHAAADALTTLGIARADDVLDFSESATVLWNGQTVTATDVLIAYTWAGDANLDGAVDGGDYAWIDSFVGALPPAVSYLRGDFNHDGAIDGGDYAYIDVTVGKPAV